tara:strand:- start:256 stop:888 length:633 start_codon:yes stop_codon:yes gene_type:complete
MILYCAADTTYFDYYFHLWAHQANKFYPDVKKYVAIYKPTIEQQHRCQAFGVEWKDVTDSMPTDPIRKHFYLLRWLNLPYERNEPILETQINCLPIKTQNFGTPIVEHLRIARDKSRGRIGGVSAAVFTPEGAKKVVEKAKCMIQDPPENDHLMNLWQLENLTHEQIKTEQQFKLLGRRIQHETCWITAGTSQHHSAEEKINVLRYYINE